MAGIKSQAKKYLKEKGIKRVQSKNGFVKLENARTIDVLNLALAKGF